MNTPSALPLHSDERAQRALREAIEAKRQQLELCLGQPSSPEQERLRGEVEALERVFREMLAPRLDTQPMMLYYEHHGSLTFLDRETQRRFGLALNRHLAKELTRHCHHYLERSKYVGWEPGPRPEDVWNP